MNIEHPFDLAGLHAAIDAARSEQAVSWAELGRIVGVAPSTIRRFAHATDAEADGVLALLRWLGIAPEAFIKHSSATPERLPAAPGGVRVDMEKVARAEGAASARGRTRTTIQRLAKAALQSERSIASFTRMSDG